MERLPEWIIIAIAGGLLAWGFTSQHYEGRLSELETRIQVAHDQAAIAKKQGDENAKKITAENDANIAAIDAYYRRLLQSLPAQTGSSATPSSSQGVDAASGEQSLVGCSADFQRACILDANKVTSWQNWALRNNFPVTD